MRWEILYAKPDGTETNKLAEAVRINFVATDGSEGFVQPEAAKNLPETKPDRYYVKSLEEIGLEDEED